MRISSGGVELAVKEAGERGRPTVLLVHGYPDTKEVWSRVVPRLAERFHVVTYDVRGAGESTAPSGRKGYDLDRLADDLLAVIAAVSPGEKVHLVGHDWGSIQGWECATSPRFDGKLASFTSISGPSLDHIGHWWRAGLGRSLGQLGRSWYIWGMQLPGAAELLWKHGLGTRWGKILQRVEGVAPDSVHPAGTVMKDGVQGIGLYRQNILRRLVRPRRDAHARVPVQLIVPRRDRFVSPSVYEEVPRWTARLRRHDLDGGHWCVRSEPETIASWIEGFAVDVERGRA
jgi:pimeloyl-ACP methyl ester carboxylesterase